MDENLPRLLKTILKGHTVSTAQEMGWGGFGNGDLLALADRQFDVLLTADKRLRYQQNLRILKLAIVVFPSNKLSVVNALSPALRRCVSKIKSGDVVLLAV